MVYLYAVLVLVINSSAILIAWDMITQRTLNLRNLTPRTRYAMSVILLCGAIASLAQALTQGEILFNLIGVALCTTLALIIAKERPSST